MEILGVIPARYGSTRFPGKVLRNICGKPMIVRIIEGVSSAKKISDVIVATDEEPVKDEVKKWGGKAVLTSNKCKSGTERVGEVARMFKVDAYINIQGDEPLIKGEAIDLVAEAIEKGENFVSLFCKMKKEEEADPNRVKVVMDSNGYAIYFSRSPIPFGGPFLKHVGIYGYSREGLLKYLSLPESPLEISEKLEQLRLISNGERIKMIRWDGISFSVDTQEDIKKIEEVICGKKN